jgi:hypothetical protein
MGFISRYKLNASVKTIPIKNKMHPRSSKLAKRITLTPNQITTKLMATPIRIIQSPTKKLKTALKNLAIVFMLSNPPV